MDRWTEGKPTWHHAAHNKQGEGGLWAPRLVPLFLGCHLSLPQSIFFWKALLNDVLKSGGDGQFPAYMQHLQAYNNHVENTKFVWNTVLSSRAEGRQHQSKVSQAYEEPKY